MYDLVSANYVHQLQQALQAKEYDHAIAGFERAIALAPDRPSVRKDLAYTLLKVGETAAALNCDRELVRKDAGWQVVPFN